MLDVKVKQSFFDRSAVIAAVGKMNARNLSRAASHVWRRMKTSMRRRKKVAEPGSPPSAHAGQLRDLLYFGFDANTASTVIGPVPFKSGTAPKVLEFGGSVVGKDSRGQARTMNYRPHPFARPALEAEQAKFPELWRNSLRAN